MKYKHLIQFIVQSCGSCGFDIPQEAIACPRCGNRTIVPADLDATYQAYKVIKMEEQRVAKQEHDLEQYFEKRLEYELKWDEKWNMSWGQILFSFQGRINRGKWWWLTYFFLNFWWVSLASISDTDESNPFSNSLVGLIFNLLLLILFSYILLALSIKRLKDTNSSWGWGSLVISSLLGMSFSIFLLPVDASEVLVETIFGTSFLLMIPPYIICAFVEGTHGPNQYGPDPLLKKNQGLSQP